MIKTIFTLISTHEYEKIKSLLKEIKHFPCNLNKFNTKMHLKLVLVDIKENFVNKHYQRQTHNCLTLKQCNRTLYKAKTGKGKCDNEL